MQGRNQCLTAGLSNHKAEIKFTLCNVLWLVVSNIPLHLASIGIIWRWRTSDFGKKIVT